MRGGSLYNYQLRTSYLKRHYARIVKGDQDSASAEGVNVPILVRGFGLDLPQGITMMSFQLDLSLVP